MIRIILASVFLFAISPQSEQINCYSCYTGNGYYEPMPTVRSGVQIQIKDLPQIPGLSDIKECLETMENQIVSANTEVESCVKIDVTGTYRNPSTSKGIDTEVTLRHKILKDKCGPLGNFLTGLGDLTDADVSVSCYECDEDKCNSAISIRNSFLTFFALIVSIYAVRN